MYFPYRNPVMEEHSVGPMSSSFYQQNKHFDHMWESCHVKHLCHCQGQPLLTDLWMSHLPLLPTEPLSLNPLRAKVWEHRRTWPDPATESHPLDSPLASKPFLLPTTAEAERPTLWHRVGLVWLLHTELVSAFPSCLCPTQQKQV